jgi:hypothetical protein
MRWSRIEDTPMTEKPLPSQGLPERLTQDELADHWRISIRTLERWRVAGTGPASLKLNGRVLYRIEDVIAFEEANTFSEGRTR